MRFLLMLLCCISLMLHTTAQNSANYSYATSTTGSLTDMSSGTTQLIAANKVNVASQVYDLGFDFFFMGTHYAQFSINSSGVLRLGATVVTNTLYYPLGQSGQALITAYGANLYTHLTGKVHYKTTGTAPNRILTVEWLNMVSRLVRGGTAELTYQVRLYETTGVIEFVYGSMTMSAGGAANSNTNTPQIGFSYSNAAGAVGCITAPFSGTPAPSCDYNAIASNAYTAGQIPVLSSAANGSRRTFTFTPPTPAAASALSFTGVSLTAMTLNWTDNAINETGYAIFRSTDGINYSFVNQVAANTTSAVQTYLIGSVTYYWKVIACSEGAVSNALTGSQATSAAGIVLSNGTGGGLWSNPATWAGGVLPTSTDSVVIDKGDVVTIDMSATVYSVAIGSTGLGTLQFEPTLARTLSVVNAVTVGTGGVFQSAATGNQTGHILSVSGNITNNGVIDFSTNANTAAAAINFTGPNNSVFSGSGSTTDIFLLTINKTNATNMVELAPAAFTVSGSAIDDVPGFLTMTSGIFKISGNFTYTGKVFQVAAYTIPANFTIWLNNPNFTIAAQNGTVINNGTMRITNGSWNMGTTISTAVIGGAGASFIVEGGALNLSGRFSPNTAVYYTQTGGIVNVAMVGNNGSITASASFALPAAATFTMSGGTIYLVRPANFAFAGDWNVLCSAFNYTGGTLQAGTAATVSAFNFRIRGYVPGLVVDNTTNNKTATFMAAVSTFGDVTVNSGASLVASGQTWSILGASLVNNGTITLAGNPTPTRMQFIGAVPQAYSGSGTATITKGAGTADLTINNSLGLTIDPTSNGIVTQGGVNFWGSGGITNANKITLGTGNSIVPVVQFGFAGNNVTVGNFDVAPTVNASWGIDLTYGEEPSVRTTDVEVPAGRAIHALTVNNSNGITITGGDLSLSTGSVPALFMTAGNITTGSNTLILGASAASPGAINYTSGTIVGKFKRWQTGGNTDFPVGTAGAKRTASINFTSAPTTPGTLTAEWVTGYGGINGLPLTEGANTVSSTSNDGYWRITAGDGLTGGAYTATLTATGISQVTDLTKLVLLKRATASDPWTLNGTHVAASGTLTAPVISRTDMSGFSEFGIGSDEFVALPVNLLSFAVRKTGGSNELTWTTNAEQNNLGFEVQRSVNGSAYTKLGFIYAQPTDGNGITNLHYNFLDHTPSGTVQYYRLRQVDINGESKYSTVVMVKGDAPNTLVVTGVYPNPATSVVSLRLCTPVAEKLSVVITNMNGKAVSQQIVSTGVGNNTVPVNVISLPQGTYFIKLIGITGRQTVQAVKLIKQ